MLLFLIMLLHRQAVVLVYVRRFWLELVIATPVFELITMRALALLQRQHVLKTLQLANGYVVVIL